MNDRDKLIVDNMNLVYYVLHKFYPKHLAYDEDLAQCGMIGLCEAADKFNPEVGKFSHFAIQGIRNKISLELKLRKRRPDKISLSQPVYIDGEEELTLEDVLPTEDDITFIVGEQMLSLLTPTEQEVARLRQEGKSYREIGELTGVSHEGARYICQRIKKKWRNFV